MRSIYVLILTCAAFRVTPINAQTSYVTPDHLNRAPAVTLHCSGADGVASPCGVLANPLVFSQPVGASTSANQLAQVAAEQSASQTIGASTDATYAGGSGTLNSVLKGVWSILGSGIAAVPVGGILTSRTQAIVAQVSTSIFTSNVTRRYLSFQVPQGTYIWVNLVGGVAAPNGPDCAYFAPGTFYESGQFVNRGQITVYAPVAITLSAWEG